MLCVYGVIMENPQKRIKQFATPRVSNASLVFSLHPPPRALSQAFSEDSEGGRPISGAAMPFAVGRGGPQGEAG